MYLEQLQSALATRYRVMVKSASWGDRTLLEKAYIGSHTAIGGGLGAALGALQGSKLADRLGVNETVAKAIGALIGGYGIGSLSNALSNGTVDAFNGNAKKKDEKEQEKSAASVITAAALGAGLGGLRSHMRGENAWDGVYRGVHVGGGMYGGGLVGGVGGGLLGGAIGTLLGKKLGNEHAGMKWGAGIGGAAGLLGGMTYAGKKSGEYADKKLAQRNRIESLKTKLHDALQEAYPDTNTITLQAVAPNGVSVRGSQKPAKGSLKDLYDILHQLKKEKKFNVVQARRNTNGEWDTQFTHDSDLQKAYEEAIKQD